MSKSPTQKELGREDELTLKKAKLHEIGDKNKLGSPKTSRVGMVYVTSETEKSDLAPLYMISKLNSDPSF